MGAANAVIFWRNTTCADGALQSPHPSEERARTSKRYTRPPRKSVNVISVPPVCRAEVASPLTLTSYKSTGAED